MILGKLKTELPYGPCVTRVLDTTAVIPWDVQRRNDHWGKEVPLTDWDDSRPEVGTVKLEDP